VAGHWSPPADRVGLIEVGLIEVGLIEVGLIEVGSKR